MKIKALLLAAGFLAGLAFSVSYAQDQEQKRDRTQQGDQDRDQDKDQERKRDGVQQHDRDRDQDKAGKLGADGAKEQKRQGPPDDAPRKTQKGRPEDLPPVKLPMLPQLPAQAQGPAKGALDAALTRASLALKNAGEASKLSTRYRNQARQAVDGANEAGRSGKMAGKGKGQ